MAHPDRKVLRERKKKARKKEQMLERRSSLNFLDLTPYNAVGAMRHPGFSLKFK